MHDCFFSCPKSLSSSNFYYSGSTTGVTCPIRVAPKLWEMCSHMQLAVRLQVFLLERFCSHRGEKDGGALQPKREYLSERTADPGLN